MSVNLVRRIDLRPTMREIAQVANVSVSTVSRVLSGDPAISDSRAAEIRAIAAKMNYEERKRETKKENISSLRGRLIGLISLSCSEDLLAVPTVANAINGAEAALSEAGAHVLLCHVPDPDSSPTAPRTREIEGAILFGPQQGDELGHKKSDLIQRLRNLPCVWALGRPSGCWGDSVIPSSFLAGARAADYLVDHGHTELAFLNPKPDHLHFMQREDGFAAQARRRGAHVRSFCKAPEGGWSLPLHAPMSIDVVQDLVDELLAAMPRPTAIFAAGDSVAALIFGALSLRGISVGKDISVISANNDEALIAPLRPGLTTFDVHARAIGRVAVCQLASRLAGTPGCPEVEITLESTLIERKSVAHITHKS